MHTGMRGCNYYWYMHFIKAGNTSSLLEGDLTEEIKSAKHKYYYAKRDIKKHNGTYER